MNVKVMSVAEAIDSYRNNFMEAVLLTNEKDIAAFQAEKTEMGKFLARLITSAKDNMTYPCIFISYDDSEYPTRGMLVFQSDFKTI